MTPPAAEILDCTGQRCPLPVIELAKRVDTLPVGASVRLLADDPAALVDVPAWCRMRGQELLSMTSAGRVTTFEVRRH